MDYSSDEWLPDSVTRTRYLSAVPGTQAPGPPGKGWGGPCQHRIQRGALGSPEPRTHLCVPGRGSPANSIPCSREAIFTGETGTHIPVAVSLPRDARIHFLRRCEGSSPGAPAGLSSAGGLRRGRSVGYVQLLRHLGATADTGFLPHSLLCFALKKKRSKFIKVKLAYNK